MAKEDQKVNKPCLTPLPVLCLPDESLAVAPRPLQVVQLSPSAQVDWNKSVAKRSSMREYMRYEDRFCL